MDNWKDVGLALALSFFVIRELFAVIKARNGKGALVTTEQIRRAVAEELRDHARIQQEHMVAIRQIEHRTNNSIQALLLEIARIKGEV